MMSTPFQFASRNQPLTTLPNHSTPKNKNDVERKNFLNRGKQDVFIACKENSMQTDAGLFNVPGRISNSSPVKVYKDRTVLPECPVTTCCRDTQTDDSLLDSLIQERCSITEVDSGRGSTINEQVALDLLVNDTPSESYWKDLAEERRRALEETLEENKKLCSLNESLREENLNLSEVAKKAEALEELLKDIMPDEDEGCDDVDNQEKTSEHKSPSSLSDSS